MDIVSLNNKDRANHYAKATETGRSNATKSFLKKLDGALSISFKDITSMDLNTVGRKVITLESDTSIIDKNTEALIDNNISLIDSWYNEALNAVKVGSPEVAMESFDLTPAQIQAGRWGALIATNPSRYMNRLNEQAIQAYSPNGRSVTFESGSIDQALMPEDMGQIMGNFATAKMEAYDGQKLKNAITYNIAYNIAAARQDEFGEAFFPTIVIDPTQSGFDTTLEYASIFNEITRSITGAPDKLQMGKTPVIKNVFNDNIFGSNKLQCVPVLRQTGNAETTNADMFLVPCQYIDTSSGEPILTAPLKIKKDINLLGISATDKQLSKGVIDNTDALDRHMKFESIYYTMTSTSGSTTSTYYYQIPVAEYAYNIFIADPQQHYKTLLTNFNAQIPIKISAETLQCVTAGGTVAEGNTPENVFEDQRFPGNEMSSLSASAGTPVTNGGAWAACIADPLLNNGYLEVDLYMSGQCNTFVGDIRVMGEISFAKFRNAAGQLIFQKDVVPDSTSANYKSYQTLMAAVQSMNIAGYTVNARRTNSNVRTRGVLVTTDIVTKNYSVPVRSGITVLLPVNNLQGTNNDVGSAATQAIMAGLFASNTAVDTLVNFSATFQSAIANGIQFTGIEDNLTTSGPNSYIGSGGGIYGQSLSTNLIRPYFASESFDLVDIVDSLNSTDRMDDIRNALINKIRIQAVNMMIESNYGIAFSVLNQGKKMSVVLGTDPVLKTLLVGESSQFALTADIDAYVVATQNPKIRGKVFMVFSVFDENRGRVYDPLNFGNMIWAPTLSYEVIKTHNNAVNREIHNNPVFLHIVNLPIMCTFNIGDVSNIFNKLPIYTNTYSTNVSHIEPASSSVTTPPQIANINGNVGID